MTSAAVTPGSPAKKRWVRWLVSALLLTVFLCFAPLVKHYGSNCALCGMHRHQASFFGATVRTTGSETDCSRWYAKNVESSHEHVWVGSRGWEKHSLARMPISVYVTGEADGPLYWFSTYSRLLMYQKCPDPKLARETFLQLARWERESTEERKRQDEIVRRLAQWESSDFEGPRPL